MIGMKFNINDIDTDCTECGGRVVRTDTTEFVCKECGLVATTRETNRGRQTFKQNDTSTAYGPSSTLGEESNRKTCIGKYTDGQGNKLPGHKRRKLGRLRNHQRRQNGRNTCVEDEIKHLCGALEYGDSTVQMAHVLFKRFQEENDGIRGYNICQVAAGAVLGAIRQSGGVTRPSEIAQHTDYSSDDIRHIVRRMQKQLDANILPPQPEEYLPRAVSELGVSGRLTTLARKLIKASCSCSHRHVPGSSHKGRAGAALLVVALGDRDSKFLTQSEVADVFDVANKTIREHFSPLREIASNLFCVSVEDILTPAERLRNGDAEPPQTLEIAPGVSVEEAITQSNGRVDTKDTVDHPACTEGTLFDTARAGIGSAAAAGGDASTRDTAAGVPPSIQKAVLTPGSLHTSRIAENPHVHDPNSPERPEGEAAKSHCLNLLPDMDSEPEHHLQSQMMKDRLVLGAVLEPEPRHGFPGACNLDMASRSIESQVGVQTGGDTSDGAHEIRISSTGPPSPPGCIGVVAMS